MAYGLKWYSEFKDVKGRLVRVEVEERDYAGLSSHVVSAGHPVVIALADNYTNDPYYPIRPTKATFEWISDGVSGFDIHSLFITDDKQFRVKVLIDSELWWIGYLTFTNCEEQYVGVAHPVSFSAVCGLAFLEKNEVLDVDGKYFQDSTRLSDILLGGIKAIGHDIDIEDTISLVDQASVLVVNYSFLYSVNIDGDGLRGMNYHEFLSGMLNAAGAYITQSKGRWVIRDIRNQTEDTVDGRLYDTNWSLLDSPTWDKIVPIIAPGDGDAMRYIRPTPSVIDSLASPKSKISVNVQPGIQVNRLLNGAFVSSNGIVPDDWTVYGTATGKDLSSGSGTPSDPFKLDMNWDTWGKGNNGGVVSQPIILNIGSATGNPASFNIKIKGSAVVRGMSTPYAFFKVTLNLLEREYGSYLKSSGDWSEPMKHNKLLEVYGFPDPSVMPNVSLDNANTLKDYDECDVQTLMFESKPITNWVKDGSDWKAYIRLDIAMPPPFFQGQTPTPRVWIEDFAIVIDTETPYEGDHTYEIDATDIILNGGEYTYNITIADKINIDTLEQKRLVNRVMTGYTYISILPTGNWNRIVSGDPDPIDDTPMPLQYLSLRERIRLLCGKRRILEGTFYGFGVVPDSSVVNTLELGDSKYMVTGWEWDVKDNRYNLTLFELTYEKLDNEEIKLVVDDGTGRRSRLSVSGSAGAGSGAVGSVNPIVFGDIPLVTGIEKTPINVTIDLMDYIESTHTEEEITISKLVWPSWATVSISGTEVTITGKNPDAGQHQILLEAVDLADNDFSIPIQIEIFPTTTATYTLTPGGKITPGLPKQIAHDPPYSLAIRVEGGHDRYQWEVKGPSLNDTSGPTAVSYTEDATYTPFSGENLAKGIYTFSIVTWRDIATEDDEDPVWTEVHRSTAVVIIGENIGDDDPDETIKVTLEPVGAELTGAGTAVEYLEEWNIALEPIGIIHDELFISIMPEQEPFMAELQPTTTNVGSAGDNEELDPIDGTGTPNADWYVTELTGVTEGERYWSDGEFFCYDSNGDFVSHHAEGELIVPAGVTEIKVNKKDSQPGLMLVEFEDYTLFPADTAKPAGAYSGFIRAFISGTQVYEKYVKWTIQEPAVEEPEAEGGLILIEPGSVFSTIANLPLTGGVYPLPSGWNVLCPDFGGVEFDRVDWTLEQDLGGWSEIDIPRFTGRDSVKTFSLGPGGAGEVTANAYLFWTKASTDIGSIHTAPSRFRATFNAWFEGVKVATRQADFLFREAGPLGDPSNLNLGWKIPEDSSIFVDKIDIPQTGGYYPIDESSVAIGRKWVVYPKEYGLDGVTEFITTKVFVQGFLVATVVNYGGLPQPTIGALFSEYLDWGELDGEGNRIVGGTNIDLPGQYHVKYEFWDESTLVGTLEADLFLYEPSPKIKDPSDCCKPGSGAGETHEIYFPASTEWVWSHGFSFKPIFRIIIGGEEWDTAVTHTLGTTTIHWNRPRAGYIVFED